MISVPELIIRKKGLQELIRRISQNQVEKVVVLYKDRLLRFGFELIEYIASLYNCEIEITSEIVSRKPRFICIEDLNVSGMMKNRHLSKAVQNQGFFEFRKQLEHKCRDKGIQLIVADRFYPSSKLCSCCGNIKKDLKLSDRIYKCDCGNVIDRDFQASINLKAYGERVAS